MEVNAPLIVRISLLVDIESMTKVQLIKVELIPTEHFYDPDPSIDCAPVEYSEGIFHFGMKNLTIPPTGIGFLGVIEMVQSLVAPTI